MLKFGISEFDKSLEFLKGIDYKKETAP